jgi:hypothetical protein
MTATETTAARPTFNNRNQTLADLARNIRLVGGDIVKHADWLIWHCPDHDLVEMAAQLKAAGVDLAPSIDLITRRVTNHLAQLANSDQGI